MKGWQTVETGSSHDSIYHSALISMHMDKEVDQRPRPTEQGTVLNTLNNKEKNKTFYLSKGESAY
jgi:hypothetical protein